MIMTNNENSKLIEKSYINKKQRKRSVFDFEQIRQLEYVFDQITHYPDLSIRQYLNHLTQLPDKKIQVCFIIMFSKFFMDLNYSYDSTRFGFKIVALNGVNNIN